MSTQPTPPLGNASPSLEVTLSSPVLLLNYTRLLLRARAATSSAAVSSQSDPLAVLLFLLDAVTFLVSSTEVGGESNAEGLDPTGDGAADESLSLSIQAAGSSSATPSRSLRAQEGARSEGPSSMRASAISGDGPVQPVAETWEDWSDYIAEVVSRPAIRPSSSVGSSELNFLFCSICTPRTTIRQPLSGKLHSRSAPTMSLWQLWQLKRPSTKPPGISSTPPAYQPSLSSLNIPLHLQPLCRLLRSSSGFSRLRLSCLPLDRRAFSALSPTLFPLSDDQAALHSAVQPLARYSGHSRSC